jgi:hypothetical protein
MLNACTKTLVTFKLGYGASAASLGLGSLSTVALCKCRNLKRLFLGDPEDFHKPKALDGRLLNLKKLVQFKQFSLEYLTLYQADGFLID